MDPNSSWSSMEAGHQAESPGRDRGFSTVLDIVENKVHTGAIQGTLVQKDTHKQISINKVHSHSPERQFL